MLAVIAEDENIDIESIMQANPNLKPARIQVNDVILLPIPVRNRAKESAFADL